MATPRKPSRKKRDDPTTLDLPALGAEGDSCAECGAGLATDQRYCLNCGERRAGPRLDFERMMGGGAGGPATAGTAPMMVAAPARNEWSPLIAIGSIAILGGMLLIGVLIGNNNDNSQTVAAAPTATAAAATTDTTAAAATDTTAAAKTKGATAGGGANPVAVKGGSGDTTGIPAADTSAKTGKAAADASKTGPNVVATQGAPAEQDPNGAAGNGSSATVIGGN